MVHGDEGGEPDRKIRPADSLERVGAGAKGKKVWGVEGGRLQTRRRLYQCSSGRSNHCIGFGRRKPVPTSACSSFVTSPWTSFMSTPVASESTARRFETPAHGRNRTGRAAGWFFAVFGGEPPGGLARELCVASLVP